MQPSDNDMDDLFRDAAENYPLRVSGADWDKIAGALSGQHAAQPLKAQSSRKKYLWLLLLLLMPFVCNIYHQFSESKAAKGAAAFLKEDEENVTYPSSNNITTSINKAAPVAQDLGNNPAAPQNNASTNNYDPASFSSDLSAYVSRKNTVSKKSKTAVQVSSPQPEDETGTEVYESPATVDPVIKDESAPAKDDSKKNKIPGNVIGEAAKDSGEDKAVKKEKQQRKAEKKFYVNLLAGPDASKVKGKSSGRAGSSVGLTLGFNINKRIAVEAGALYSVKHYSTEYAYFNNSKTQWPSNRIINTIDGTCRMIELPVTVRYNFNTTPKSKFFAAAGLSSYLMKKEDYEYEFTTGTGTAENEAYKTYKNSGNNLFSVLQLSAGWQRNIGRFGAVRIQPYYNVPLNGVGIGKLPLSGAGVLAGISIPIK